MRAQLSDQFLIEDDQFEKIGNSNFKKLNEETTEHYKATECSSNRNSYLENLREELEIEEELKSIFGLKR